MKKRTIERYRQVQRVMLTLPEPKKFRINVIANRDGYDECPTSACALGWCGMDPWFLRRGLKTEFHRLDREGNVNFRPRRRHTPLGASYAIRDFFDDHPHTSHIFGMGADRTRFDPVRPLDVVFNIERRLQGLPTSDYDVGRVISTSELPAIKLKELRRWGRSNGIEKKVRQELGLAKPA